MKISLIACIDQARGLGKEGKLLFRISADLKHFKEITLNHPLIMGRKTFESLPGSLAGRKNIIISRNEDYKTEGAVVCSSLKEALEEANKGGVEEVFIIGGGQVYSQAINLADKLYLTLVKAKLKADVFFPDFNLFKKKVFVKREV